MQYDDTAEQVSEYWAQRREEEEISDEWDILRQEREEW